MHCCVINGDKHSTVSVHNFGEAMAIFSKFARIMDLKLDDKDDAIPGGTYWDMPQLRVCQLRHFLFFLDFFWDMILDRPLARSAALHHHTTPAARRVSLGLIAETDRALAI